MVNSKTYAMNWCVLVSFRKSKRNKYRWMGLVRACAASEYETICMKCMLNNWRYISFCYCLIQCFRLPLNRTISTGWMAWSFLSLHSKTTYDLDICKIWMVLFVSFGVRKVSNAELQNNLLLIVVSIQTERARAQYSTHVEKRDGNRNRFLSTVDTMNMCVQCQSVSEYDIICCFYLILFVSPLYNDESKKKLVCFSLKVPRIRK